MNEEIDTCSRQLRRLGQEYYRMQLTQVEYRDLRKQVLDKLESELHQSSEDGAAQTEGKPESTAVPT